MSLEWNGSLFGMVLDSSLRVALVAAIVALILFACRVRSSGVRHAAWTAVLCAMLLMPVLPYCVPSIPLPAPAPANDIQAAFETPEPSPSPAMLQRGEAAVPAPDPGIARVPSAAALPARGSVWPAAAIVLYASAVFFLLSRMLLGWISMRRIVRASAPVALEERIDPSLRPFAAPVYESGSVAAPLTAGIISPRVLLPLAWKNWPADKLSAVLAHEFAHVRRRDPLIGLLAHLNRCVFWFHPLAWWLERKLATTAELASDDAAMLAIGGTRRYAEILLDMAEAVRRSGGRLAWQGVGVHGSGLLGRRIDRILRGDLWREISGTRKAVVAFGCAAAIFLVVACREKPQPAAPLQEDPKYVQLRAQQKADGDLYRAAHDMNAQQVADLEASLKKNPEDLAALKKLLEFYAPASERVPGEKDKWAPRCAQVLGEKECIAARRPHILWLIEHHPDNELAGSWGARIYPTSLDPLPDPAGYAQAKKLWLAKTSAPEAGLQALKNASYFFEVADKPLAEKMMLRAQALDPKGHWSGALGRLYAFALVGSNSSTPLNVVRTVSMEDAHGAYAQEVRKKLAGSQDAELLAAAGDYLVWARGLYMSHKIDFDPIPLAKSYLERALQLDPQSTWARMRLIGLRAGDRNIRMREILKNVPKESQYQTIAALPEAERLQFLPELAIDEYYGGENAEYSRHDQAEAKADWQRSGRYARDLLQMAPRFQGDPNYGVAVYMGNIVLGTLALRDGDRKAAVDYLLTASHAPAAPDLDYFMFHHARLTGYLLKYGERDSVIEFLERIAQVSVVRKSELLDNASQIRKGIQPSWYPRERADQGPGR
jgi:beta-lactamase regulating signal transducer with metallopeptidase domain